MFAIVDDRASILVDVVFPVGFDMVVCDVVMAVLNTCDVDAFDVTFSVVTLADIVSSFPSKYMLYIF